MLPRSEAPVAAELRTELSRHLRTAVLRSRDPDVLLDYARTGDGMADVETWQAALHSLPADSPRRSAVTAHLEQLDAELR